MIAKRMMNVVLRQPLPMAFMFSTKKKQMELTIKTPYRKSAIIQKLSPNHSPDSAESLQKLNNQPLLSKTEHHPLFIYCLQAISDSSLMARPKVLLTNISTQADG